VHIALPSPSCVFSPLRGTIFLRFDYFRTPHCIAVRPRFGPFHMASPLSAFLTPGASHAATSLLIFHTTWHQARSWHSRLFTHGPSLPLPRCLAPARLPPGIGPSFAFWASSPLVLVCSPHHFVHTPASPVSPQPSRVSTFTLQLSDLPSRLRFPPSRTALRLPALTCAAPDAWTCCPTTNSVFTFTFPSLLAFAS